MKYFLMYLWQLPQNLLGALYRDILAYKDKVSLLSTTKDYNAYTKESLGSVALGRYVFLSPNADEFTIKHELGHVKQSKLLGPLYLLIIGLPSIIWAILHNKIAPKKSYYWFYTERWANKLSKISK